MRNVTIVVEEDVARWARVEAAQRGTSVSRLLGEMLRERMEAERRYEEAGAEFCSIAARPLREPGTGLPSREEVHDRAGLR